MVEKLSLSEILLKVGIDNLNEPWNNNFEQSQLSFLYPVKSTDVQVLERVFGAKPEDISQLPERSSLQAAIKNYYMSGGYLKQGGMFLLKEDLNWGSEIYQKDFE